MEYVGIFVVAVVSLAVIYYVGDTRTLRSLFSRGGLPPVPNKRRQESLRAHDSYGRLKDELGFVDFQSSPLPPDEDGVFRALSGEIEGLPILLRAESENKWVKTIAEMQIHPALPAAFVCDTKGKANDGTFTGDEMFDALWSVSCDDHGAMMRILAPEVRDALGQLLQRSRRVKLTERELVVEIEGEVVELFALRRLIGGMIDLGLALRAAQHRAPVEIEVGAEWAH